MTPDGHCKLLDFGVLAAFGSSRLVVGTPPAIPPEALQGAPLDQRADLYALGALAYWVLTERHAYPAKQVEDLKALWKEPPPPPSAVVPGIPKELDALVLSLLSANPLARPASAAEVIARLNVVGELPARGRRRERATRRELPPQPPVHRPRRPSRDGQGADRRAPSRARAARSSSRRPPASGARACSRRSASARRSPGACVVRVDASMSRGARGTARALAVRMLDAVPAVRPRIRLALRARRSLSLGPDVESPPRPPADRCRRTRGRAEAETDAGGQLEAWFAEISRVKAARRRGRRRRRRRRREPRSPRVAREARRAAPDLARRHRARAARTADAAGLVTLRGQCERLELDGLSPAETLELARSLFGDAPNVERFAEWLHGRTAGSPLHCIEISRQLVARDVVRYLDGMWVLPVDRPDAGLPAALEDALSIRLGMLTVQARVLAECLSLRREDPTLDLCRQLVIDGEPDEQDPGRKVLLLLDELARNDVLYVDQSGYRFSSVALRDALLSGMDGASAGSAGTAAWARRSRGSRGRTTPRCSSKRAGTSSRAATTCAGPT